MIRGDNNMYNRKEKKQLMNYLENVAQNFYPYLKAINEGRVSNEDVEVFQTVDDSYESLEKKRNVLQTLGKKLQEEEISIANQTKEAIAHYEKTKGNLSEAEDGMRRMSDIGAKVRRVLFSLADFNEILKRIS